MDSSEALSYRQVGTRTAGSVYRGSTGRKTSTAIGKRTSSSIPSKFETTLHQGTEEKKAFGSRVHRFREYDDPLPGPGSYHRSTTLVRDAATCGSVSQRGYSTGFVSKSDRFNKTTAIVSALAPGPGSYRSYNTANTVPARDFRQSATQAIFAPPTHPSAAGRGDVASSAREVPGPGHYDIKHRESTAQMSDARLLSGCFRSSVRRFERSKRELAAQNLAPGAYDVGASYDAVLAQGRLVGGRDPPNATFISTVPRSRHIEAAVTDAARKPGPGAYDDALAYAAITELGPGSAAAAAQSSCMFANTQQDRFGRPYVDKAPRSDVPGPGWYEAASDTRLPRDAGMSHEAAMLMSVPSSSMFNSKSSRMSDHQTARARLSRAPGPAYYKPEKPNAKSFLLNTSKKWV